MSTPSVVEFVGDINFAVYVHHDGYPERMIPLLKEFLKWNKSRNDDAGYAAANFIYWYKKRALKKARAMTREYKAEERDHRGFLLQVEQSGVGFYELGNRYFATMADGYINYLYRVNLPTEGQLRAVVIQHYKLPRDTICNDPDQEVEVIV